MSLRNTAKSVHTWISVRLFKNKIGVLPNLLHSAYSLFLLFGPRVKGTSEAGRELQQNGYVKLPPFLDRSHILQISEKLNSLLADESKVFTSMKGVGLIRLKNSMLELPECEEFLKSAEVQEALRTYFGSSFMVFKCDVFRLFPLAQKNDETLSSLRWHFDNAPRSLVKLMVYLTDATAETGATSMVPKPVSRRLQLAGFWDRKKSEKFESEILQNRRIVEGEAGSCIFFTPQFCIHRGTLPEKKWRDVIVFELYPTNREFTDLTIGQRQEYSRDYDGYITNPFTGKSRQSKY